MAKKKEGGRKWEYRVFGKPMLPPHADSPVCTSEGIEWWLNTMDSRGWEFIGSGGVLWHDISDQAFWVFRRLKRGAK